MARLTCCVAVILFVGAPVLADQYWIAYEGNDFPEKEGWTRRWVYKEAKRWLEDGTLVIDSRESIEIADWYRKDRTGELDPGPGETFVCQWRIRPDQVIGPWDPGVAVRSDGGWDVVFTFSVDTVYSTGEPGTKLTFAPGVFHEFELRSSDMRRYELWMDGALGLTGLFRRGVGGGWLSWGDLTEGGAGLARWDYMRFGVVVPEPNTGLLLTFCLASRRVWR
ncbi:MAG: hypothetical protein WBC49_01005 [Thermoplasmata archaeon]